MAYMLNHYPPLSMIRSRPHKKNPLQVSIGLITRSMANKFKDVFNELIRSIWKNVNVKKATSSESNDKILINLTYV